MVKFCFVIWKQPNICRFKKFIVRLSGINSAHIELESCFCVSRLKIFFFLLGNFKKKKLSFAKITLARFVYDESTDIAEWNRERFYEINLIFPKATTRTFLHTLQLFWAAIESTGNQSEIFHNIEHMNIKTQRELRTLKLFIFLPECWVSMNWERELTSMDPAAQFNAAFVRFKKIIGLKSSSFVT